MLSPALEHILAGRVHNPRTDTFFDPGTRQIVIDESLAGKEVDLIRLLDIGPVLGLLTDDRSEQVLGEVIQQRITGTFSLISCRLPGRAHADEANLTIALDRFASVDGIIVVGSGSLNDLGKMCAARLGKPYAIFATAPSMNGYASRNASIMMHGHKKTLPAVSPHGIFIDLEIFAAAPQRMIVAGLGDSLARSTAQVDWLLSHLLIGTAYSSLPFDLLLPLEDALFSEPKALLRGDLKAHRLLAETLLISGFGMNMAGGSYPASQAEHLLAHYMEMTGPTVQSFHGEQIALTARHMAFIHEALLQGKAPILASAPVVEATLIGLFGEESGRECWREYQQKVLSREKIDRLNHHLEENWPSITRALGACHRSHAEMERIVKEVNGPMQPDEVCWDHDLYRRALTQAHFLRNRFTALDFYFLSGSLEKRAAEILS